MKEGALTKILIVIGIICISSITILQYQMVSLGKNVETSAFLFKICSKDNSEVINNTKMYTCEDLEEFEINKIDCGVFENKDKFNSCRKIKKSLREDLGKCNEIQNPLSVNNQKVLHYKKIESDCNVIFNR